MLMLLVIDDPYSIIRAMFVGGITAGWAYGQNEYGGLLMVFHTWPSVSAI